MSEQRHTGGRSTTTIERGLLDALDYVVTVVTADRGRLRNVLVLVLGPVACFAAALAIVAAVVFYFGGDPIKWAGLLAAITLLVAGCRLRRRSGR